MLQQLLSGGMEIGPDQLAMSTDEAHICSSAPAVLAFEWLQHSSQQASCSSCCQACQEWTRGRIHWQ